VYTEKQNNVSVDGKTVQQSVIEKSYSASSGGITGGHISSEGSAEAGSGESQLYYYTIITKTQLFHYICSTK